MKPILAIVVCTCMGFLAKQKGFHWWLWVLAGGLPGFIVLLCMPSAMAQGIDEATRIKRRKNGNLVGGIISAIALILIVGLILWIRMLLQQSS